MGMGMGGNEECYNRRRLGELWYGSRQQREERERERERDGRVFLIYLLELVRSELTTTGEHDKKDKKDEDEGLVG